jgi:hypothetical protein
MAVLRILISARPRVGLAAEWPNYARPPAMQPDRGHRLDSPRRQAASRSARPVRKKNFRSPKGSLSAAAPSRVTGRRGAWSISFGVNVSGRGGGPGLHRSACVRCRADGIVRQTGLSQQLVCVGRCQFQAAPRPSLTKLRRHQCDSPILRLRPNTRSLTPPTSSSQTPRNGARVVTLYPFVFCDPRQRQPPPEHRTAWMILIRGLVRRDATCKSSFLEVERWYRWYWV